MERLPARFPTDVRARLDYLQEHREKFDTVFIGSSAFFRHAIPEQFDAAMAKLGYPVHSVNLGIPSGVDFEADTILREVLALELPNLKYVFMDGLWITPRVKEENRMTRRVIWWHDLTATVDVMRAIKQSGFELEEARDLTLLHLRHLMLRVLSVSNGYEVLRAALGLPPDDPEWEPIVAMMQQHRGYEGFHNEASPAGRRKVFLAGEGSRSAKRFEQQTRQLMKEWKNPTQPVVVQPFRFDVLARQARKAGAQGAKVLYVFPPNARLHYDWLAVQQNGYPVRLIALNNPARFPELFDLANRYDYTHLEHNGAEFYTKYLAQEAAALLSEETP